MLRIKKDNYTIDEIRKIADAIHQYGLQSQFTPRPVNELFQSVLYSIKENLSQFITIWLEDKLVAFSEVSFEDVYHTEKLGYIEMFWVSFRHRGRIAQYMLLEESEEVLKQLGCEFVSVMGIVDKTATQFKNFMEQEGYKPHYTTLMKDLTDV